MYQSPFSTNEIKYFMNLMQNDNAEGKGATYAKLDIYKVEILNKINHGGSILHKDFAYEITNKRLKEIKGSLL